MAKITPLAVRVVQDKTTERIMISRGVPRQDLMTKRHQFVLEDCLVKMEIEFDGVPSKSISVPKQLRSIEHILADPLAGMYTLGISSFPTDQRAKHLALMIMAKAIELQAKHKRISRGLPLWHRVYGGAVDILRDKPVTELPSMLILTNINDAASGTKIEKVRDLLEKYADIPRIVVSGGEPPVALFAGRLQYPMRAGAFLGPPGMLKET